MQSASTSLFTAFHVADFRLLGFLNTSTAISNAFSAVVFFGLLRSPQSVSFTDEVIDELSKVTWPSKDETIQASTTVVFTTFFTAAILGGFDLMWDTISKIVFFNASNFS